MIFEQERTVSSAFIDSTTKLGIAQAVLMVQDNLTECFAKLECDGLIYREKYNCFWVFTKTKLHFARRPDWRQKIRAVTFPADNAGMRTHVNTALYDKDGNILVTANQEACVLSLDTHRPVKLTTLPYPKEGFPEPVFTEPFEKIPDITAGQTPDPAPVYEQTIRSQHIDMSHHMNNIEYIKLGLSTFTDDFLESNEPENLEVHYTGESKEGQTLEIFREGSGKTSLIVIKEKESRKTVFEMKISFY